MSTAENVKSIIEKAKVIVFDIDDTLLLSNSVKRYNGYTYVEDSRWNIENATSNYYKDSEAPIGMLQLAELLKPYIELGLKHIYALTSDSSTFAFINKSNRLREVYRDVFSYDNVLFVNNSNEKVEILECLYKRHEDTKRTEILLIDDKLETLSLADKQGYIVIHTSTILDVYTRIAYGTEEIK